MRLVALLLALVSFGGGSVSAQEPLRPDVRDGPLFRLDSRLGFLVTSGDTFGDRPVWQIDGGIQLGPARPGRPPALGFTVGVSVGAAEFLGPTTTSTRVMGGIELPWALSSTLELVPAVQAGYLRAAEEDERSGFVSRWAIGIRILPRRQTFYFGFEPASLVTLPRPDDPVRGDPGARAALELGVLRFGWRF